MEEGRATDQDYDEIEMLLGEIPNATSDVVQVDGSARITIPLPKVEVVPLEFKEDKTSPSSTLNNFCHSPPSAKQVEDELIYRRLNSTDGSGNLVPTAWSGEAFFPYDHRLASSFQNLMLNDVGRGQVAPAMDMYNNSLEPSLGFGMQYPVLEGSSHESANMATFLLDAANRGHMTNHRVERRSPSAIWANNLMVGTNSHDVGTVEVDDSQFSHSDISGFFGDINGTHNQSFFEHSAQRLVDPGIQSFRLHANAPVPGPDFSALTFQQQSYFDASSTGHVPYHYVNQPYMVRQDGEAERHFKMQQSLLYMQNAQKLRRETQPACMPGVGMVGSSYGSPVRSYTRMSPHFERTTQDIYLNGDVASGISNQSNCSTSNNADCSSVVQGYYEKGHNYPRVTQHKQSSFTRSAYRGKGYNAFLDMGHMRRQSFPTKLVTRYQELSSLRNTRSGRTKSSEISGHDSVNGRILSSGLLRQSSEMSGDSFRVIDSISQGQFDNLDIRTPSRQSHLRFYSVDEIVGKIYALAKDQNGCRFLQKKFAEGTQDDLEKIFLEIIVHIVELMTDPFGNYLVQKLLEVCTEDHRTLIICELTKTEDKLLRISCDIHGTRAVQKVIETLKTKEQCSMIVSALQSGVVDLMKNNSGNHVVQRCLQHLMPGYREFIFDAAVACWMDLATDRHGCCVLQKCVTYGDDEEKHQLLSKIISGAFALSQDEYGNYVVQCIMERKISWATLATLDQLEGKFAILSKHKYGSNVVEKCLCYSEEDGQARIVRELIEHSKLLGVMDNAFGNYVIQTALKNCTGSVLTDLVDAIRLHIPNIKYSRYGKKVLDSEAMKRIFLR